MKKTVEKIDNLRDSNGKLIQNLPDRITHDDIENFEIIGNPDLLDEVSDYLEDILPQLQVDFQDFIELMGLKPSQYSTEDIANASVWRKASEAQREGFKTDLRNNITDERIIIFNEIIRADIEKSQRFLNLILSLARLWAKDKKSKERALNIIAKSIYPNSNEYPKNSETGLKLLKVSDYTISAEIFLGILIKPAEAWNKLINLKKKSESLLNGLL
jgi:hypothetical protein